MIDIQFCGAAQTVTGSQHLITVNGKRILLDCGLYQGKRADTYERNRHFPFDPSSVDVLVLSHAHIDHSGNIPNLVKQGFNGEIISTHATRDLCVAMLMDSAHIHESDAEYLNEKKRKHGEPLIEPLYTQEDATHCLSYFSTIGYDRPRLISPGVTMTFHDAGHMLGSAFVVLDIEDEADKRDLCLVFSGDIGRIGLPILRDPRMVDRADVLIMESTYGDRLHPPYDDDAQEMKRIILDAHHRGGKIIIPAFAVGRTQQLVYTLHQLALNGEIPNIPIFVDSPLAIDVTNVYRLHPECYDDEIRAFMLNEGRRIDPFGFDRLRYTRTTDESKQLNSLEGSAVIIAASGMAEAGRILHHLKNNIENPATTILIVGFQAENTLGRRIADKARQVKIFGETYDNHAHVEVLTGFSGHADRDELLAWVAAMRSKPRNTYLVHGEIEPARALASSLHAQFGLDAEVPALREMVTV